MKTFTVTVKNEVGIHGRPAVELVKLARNFPNTAITVKKGDKAVDATKLLMLMGLGVVKNDVVDFLIEGGDEEAALKAIEEYSKKELEV